MVDTSLLSLVNRSGEGLERPAGVTTGRISQIRFIVVE
jgi:hypothetical protein